MPSEDSTRGAPESSVFPSGAWTGYWIQGAEQGSQDLRLHFSQGRLRGNGTDRVGSFLIHGGYDDAAREVWFAKQYLGAHVVAYRGFADGGVGVWGTWQIAPFAQGGFRIWPRDHGATTSCELAVAEPLLVGDAPGILATPRA